jgi:hypothetical protein
MAVLCRSLLAATAALSFSLWTTEAFAESSRLVGAVEKSFLRVESMRMGDDDPCEAAVFAMTDKTSVYSFFEPIMGPCRGRYSLFSERQVEECLLMQNSPEIQEMIDEGIDNPTVVCRWRKFWLSAKSNSLSSKDSCELCEQTVQMIEDTLKKQEMEVTVIQQLLQLLCHYLPEKSKCKVLEDKFDEIVNWVKEGLSPHHICQKISLCDIANALTRKQHTYQQATQVKKDLATTTDNHDATAHVNIPKPFQNKEKACRICHENGLIMQQLFKTSPLHGLDLYKQGIVNVCNQDLQPGPSVC